MKSGMNVYQQDFIRENGKQSFHTVRSGCHGVLRRERSGAVPSVFRV